jgi:hypothetical protein
MNTPEKILYMLEWRHQMKHINRWMIVLVVIVGLQLAACAPKAPSAEKIVPFTLEPIGDTGFNKVILTEAAAERLGVQTTPVREQGGNLVVPYAAVIYDLHGETWLYTSPAPLTFVRETITVESINGDEAILSVGPASGTEVAIVGVPELYGADTGIGK